LKIIQVAVIGGGGYAGAELLRLLSLHPQVRISCVTSEQSAGKDVGKVFPSLQHRLQMQFEKLDAGVLAQKADFFFVALPSGSAMDCVAELVKKGKLVVDLSADYRLRDPGVYEKWYRQPHRHAALLDQAVYGLPEIHREKIKQAQLVGNPGCYPVTAILALTPLMKSGGIDPDRPLLIDSKSGISGAGRSPALGYHFPEANEGLVAYGLGGHRHVPEMEQELSQLSGYPVTLTFTPHLIPMNRGILTTAYLSLGRRIGTQELVDLYRDFYKSEPFVRVLDGGESPNPHHLRGSNVCQIGLSVDERTGVTVLLAAIDNLVKGAAGQAIQNMNLMMGLEETLGLESSGVFP
jgi:N-acetyl-gamma-glutamyl-phosphate reductase